MRHSSLTAAKPFLVCYYADSLTQHIDFASKTHRIWECENTRKRLSASSDSRFCCAVTFNSILNLARRCQMSHVVCVRSVANKGECINHAPIGLRLHVNDNDYKAVFQIGLWYKNLICVSFSAETQALTSERRSIKVFSLYGQYSRNDNFVMKQILTAKPTNYTSGDKRVRTAAVSWEQWNTRISITELSWWSQ